MNSNKLICIENTRESRWIWTVDHNTKFCAIESAVYSHPEQGYTMQFNSGDEFDHWLDQRTSEGWTVSKVLDFDINDYNIIEQTKKNLFRYLSQ